jgi:hypothetical protein
VATIARRDRRVAKDIRGSSWPIYRVNDVLTHLPSAEVHTTVHVAMDGVMIWPMGSFTRKLRRNQVCQSTGDVATQIAHMRELVLNSQGLDKPADFFDKVLGPNPQFALQSINQDNPLLCSMVQVLTKVAISEYDYVEKRIFHVPTHHLWHGVLVLRSGAMARIVYFEDSNRGLCTVGRPSDGEMKHLRFSIPEEVQEPVDPSAAAIETMSLRSEELQPN